MTKKAGKEQSDLLYESILTLKDLEECKEFFQDLCTVAELRAMEQRFEVALLLSDGMIYNDILERTGASSATISRVRRAMLDNGAGGIMRDVICRTGLDKREIPPISQETQESKVEVE